MRTCVRMTTRRYSVAERDRDRPWIITAIEHLSVDLEPGVDFWDWAVERWPAPVYSVDLAPGQEERWTLSPGRE